MSEELEDELDDATDDELNHTESYGLGDADERSEVNAYEQDVDDEDDEFEPSWGVLIRNGSMSPELCEIIDEGPRGTVVLIYQRGSDEPGDREYIVQEREIIRASSREAAVSLRESTLNTARRLSHTTPTPFQTDQSERRSGPHDATTPVSDTFTDRLWDTGKRITRGVIMAVTGDKYDWVVFRNQQGKKMAGKVKGRDSGKLTVIPFAISRTGDLVPPTEDEVGNRVVISESECEFFRNMDSLRGSLESGVSKRPYSGDLSFRKGSLT